MYKRQAVSTSLYGSRGSNGVVMITTKKGQQGRTQITADAKWGAVSRDWSSDVCSSDLKLFPKKCLILQPIKNIIKI